MAVREVIILGSTGSIGTQALEVIAAHRDRLRVVGLAAGGDSINTLAQQVIEYQPAVVAVAKPSAVQDLQLALYAHAQKRGYSQGEFSMPAILAGPQAMAELAAYPCDVVLNGITGSIGLPATLAALKAGRTLALANKESLVAGGALVRKLARPSQIVPVDSEHSALAQCLRGAGNSEVRRLILTASGGPFRGRKPSELTSVTPAQALAHPTWTMGPVVTINSATLVNKGLELIETRELFGEEFAIGYDSIEVVIHPQSIVHSLVEFVDGSTLAQASRPDMRLPIALALGWPERLPPPSLPIPPWDNEQTWQFFPLDNQAFPAVRLARQAGEAGGCLPAMYNAANEECVHKFLAEQLPFPGIVDTIARVLDRAIGNDRWGHEPGNVEDVLAAEAWARTTAYELMEEATV